METIKVNLNQYILVKLTPIGVAIYRKELERIYKYFPNTNENVEKSMKALSERTSFDGYTKFQIHEFMSLFGKFTDGTFNNHSTGGMPFSPNVEIVIK